ncbi:Type II secretion system protein L [Vibrio aerogenes CECT 7868]|uniref:Type II secretion system protein L n=1 Tax=Vibrio aerogenes CECT 7868 TaxID=1216006 RepID=A0A1M5YV52_9VIBR|nr:type II secretion system protein GspL [Vibrio aerogenes]SHI15724.1 Type II secretion system protein L [Vibrio aerogenes CECT 7868]
MSEYLLVRLSNQPLSKVYWWIGSDIPTSVGKQGELNSWEEVSELAEEAGQRPVIVLLSGADVILKEVSLPSGKTRQFEKMLPYLVEDDLAQDADALHFSVLSKQGERVFTAAVDYDWMESVLALFSEAGMIVDRVLPDILALPMPESGQNAMTALQLGDEWLLRQGEYQGMCIEHGWMPLLCQNQTVSDEESDESDERVPVTVTTFSPKPESADNQQQVWTESLADSVFSLLLRGALNSPVSLMTGAFKKSSSWLKSWKIWRKSLLALAALVVLTVVAHSLEIKRLESEAQSLRDQSEHVFRTLFPDRRKIPTVSYLKRLIKNEVALLSGGDNNSSAISLFEDLSKTLSKVKDLHLQRIHYDGQQGTVRIDVTGSNFQSFEAAQKELSKYFDVEQGPLNRANKQVAGFYTLKRK